MQKKCSAALRRLQSRSRKLRAAGTRSLPVRIGARARQPRAAAAPATLPALHVKKASRGRLPHVPCLRHHRACTVPTSRWRLGLAETRGW